jgi:hypothetical protein
MGPHTHSAGTSEIARQSGGDSLPVDDASALDTTLARIRQRYALHFHLPEGVKPGQERNIEVELADAAYRRYPGAEVRYRRVYIAPEGGAAAGPTEITRAPANSRGRSTEPAVVSQAPTPKRRRAVNEPDGSRTTTPAADAASPAPATTQPPPAPATSGWPRVDDQPKPSPQP